MTEKPILFSAPMVQAILAGAKTQTRRVVKPRGRWSIEPRGDGSPDHEEPWPLDPTWTHGDDGDPWWPCPYGEPGDRLWVRETWRPFIDAWSSGIEYCAGGELTIPGQEVTELAQRTGGNLRFPGANKDFHNERWRPSIHMPRWASRITLEVTRVRVERVQEISEDDARAEGVRFDGQWFDGAPHAVKGTPKAHATAAIAFCDLWDSINGRRPGCSWADNPWVWCISFRRVAGEAQG